MSLSSLLALPALVLLAVPLLPVLVAPQSVVVLLLLLVLPCVLLLRLCLLVVPLTLVLLLPTHCVVQVKGLHLWGHLDSYGVEEVETTGSDEADKTSENVGANAENTADESGGMFDKMFDKIGSTLWEYLNRAIANLDLELHQVNLVC